MTDRISQRVSSLFLLILTVLISNMADSATHFVDASASAGGDGSSWGTAFVSISEATSAAAAGDEEDHHELRGKYAELRVARRFQETRTKHWGAHLKFGKS